MEYNSAHARCTRKEKHNEVQITEATGTGFPTFNTVKWLQMVGSNRTNMVARNEKPDAPR